MTLPIPTQAAMAAVVEQLLSAYDAQDAAALRSVLKTPELQELDEQHRGLSNIHLAFAFARLLARECPEAARDEKRVPRLDLLVGDGAESPGFVEARTGLGEEVGSPVSRAEAKASNARFAEGIPLAQMFMQVWMLVPQAVPEFVHAQSARSAVMVDAVWAVLFKACATMRSTTDQLKP
ncbi:hypothetical protein [Streptomyces graminilatus]|uniref:hypothetical protein n=1 Tax=Streptomyces graminilatus TaxID=1464070 RepID=UPI000A464939|nr:hypothetical protein [Streptomyces graminilatus]